MSDMSLDKIKLPLWALKQAEDGELDERVAAFGRHHGHAPVGDTSLAAWWAATPNLEERLGDVALVLPLVYPDHRRALLRIVVEVAYLAACRVQPPNDPDPVHVAALALVKRWLAGEAVAKLALTIAAGAVGAAANNATSWAAGAAPAAAAAANCAAAAHGAAAATAADNASHAAAWAAHGAADRADAERAQQRADLDRLLLALRLEAA